LSVAEHRTGVLEDHDGEARSYAPYSFKLDGASRYCGIPPETLRAYVRRGLIPSVHLGRALYLRRVDLEAFIDGHRDHSAPPRPLQARGRGGRFEGEDA